MAIEGAVTAVGALGYGIYAGQEAQAAQKNAINSANQNAQNAQAQEQQQYQQQQAQEAAQTAQNLATEQQTAQQTQAAQATALAQEQAAIGTNSTTLQNSLTNQEAAAMKAQAPTIDAQMQGSGLVGGGAQAQAYAAYQAGLAANAQADISNYQVGANQQLNTDTNADTAQQVQAAEANANTNIGVGEQNMATNFATIGADNQNNAAYNSYLTSLQLGQAQSQQSAANQYTNLAGQSGQGAMQYYGSQNSNPALNALYMNQQINGYGNQNYLGGGSSPANNASNGGYSGFA